MKQYIYVMKSESGLVKIGVSINPDVRRSAIETGNGFHVAIVKLFGPFNGATKVECSAHGLLRDSRVRGEWFACSVEAAINAVNSALASFVEPDDDSGMSDQAMNEIAKFMAQSTLSPAINAQEFAQQVLDRYAESIKSYSNLTDQFMESIELIDFYGAELKKQIEINERLLNRIRDLESQIQVPLFLQ